MFTDEARSRLREKLGYERWALDELESELRVFPDEGGEVTIKDGSLSVSAKATLGRISQGRVEELIQCLYPLVFTASYKCLDMIVEWILEENTGDFSRWGYSAKKGEANRLYRTESLSLPDPFTSEPILFENLLGLYGDLMDCRHAVIHRHEFSIDDEVFTVTDDNGNEYNFDTNQLFSLAKVGTVAAECLLENKMTESQARELKRYLDNLNHIHQKGIFDVAAPWSQTIRYLVEAEERDPPRWIIDLADVSRADDSAPNAKGYYLNVVGQIDGATTCEWTIPSDAVPDGDTLDLTEDSSEFMMYLT